MSRSARRAKKALRKQLAKEKAEIKKKRKLSLTTPLTTVDGKLKGYQDKLVKLVGGPLSQEFKTFIEELEKPHVPDRTEIDTGSTETSPDTRGAS